MRGDEPRPPCSHDEKEQEQRQNDSHRERADHLARIALAGPAREVIESGAEAHDDRDEREDDDESQDALHVRVLVFAAPARRRLIVKNTPRPGDGRRDGNRSARCLAAG